MLLKRELGLLMSTKKNRTIFEHITEEYDRLSKSHKKVADYILQHYDRAVYMTARQLSTGLGISESTVVRFATSLGYDGYPDFQEQLRRSARTILTTRQKLDLDTDPSSLEATINQSLLTDLHDLRATSEEVNVNTLELLASKIMNAKRVFIVGKRSSNVLVDYLAYYLNFFHNDVRTFQSTVMDHFEQLFHIEKNDLVIMFSFPRYAKSTIEMAKYLRQRGAEIIAITDSPDAPIVEYASNYLTSSYSIDSFIDSFVAPMAMVNALITALAYDNLDITKERLEVLEELWEEYDTYF